MVVHVVTTLLDGFAPITLLDVVVPFGSAYRPLWLGLGTVAFDLLSRVAITSLLRRRLDTAVGGPRIGSPTPAGRWRWSHGLGTGTDTRTHWMLVLAAGCVAVMLAAVLFPGQRRLATAPRRAPVRGRRGRACSAWAARVAAQWTAGGRVGQAGGNAGLAAAKRAARGSRSTAASAPNASVSPGSASPVTARTRSAHRPVGRITQIQLKSGMMLVNVALAVPGHELGRLDIRIEGPPSGGGGYR